MNHIESQLRDIRLFDYAEKIVDLKVIQEITNTIDDIIEQRKIALKQERKELDNINYNVWIAEDAFCNKIWNFSMEHNFNIIFDDCNNVETIKYHKCEYGTISLDTAVKQKTMLSNLEHDINIIKQEIAIIQNGNILRLIESATVTLNSEKSFSEELLDLLRLINISDKKDKKSEMKKSQRYFEQSDQNIAPPFIAAKKLMKKSTFRPRILIDRKITTTMKTVDSSEQREKTRGIVKFGTFVMKKRSHISMKIEQKLRNVE